MRSVILIIFIASCLSTKGQTYFNSRFDNYQSWWDYSWSIYADSTSIYWTYGTSSQYGISGLRVAALSVLDLSGNFINTNYFADFADTSYLYYFGGAKSLTPITNGFILGGSKVDTLQGDACLIRLNITGDTIWTKTYGDSEFQSGWMAIESWDGGYLLCGQSESIDTFSNAFLIRTDSLGNLIWQTEIGIGGFNERFVSLCLTSNGCALAGRRRDLFNTDFDIYIAIVDSSGNLQWDSAFVTANHDELWSITSTMDGNFVVAGMYASSFHNTTYPYVAKLDLQGHVLWERKFGDSLLYSGFFSIRELHDGSFILGGIYNPQVPSTVIYGLIYKIDANGDSLWSSYYYNSIYSRNYIQDICPTIDGGFVACGRIVPYAPDTGYQDLWLLKIDSMGCEQVNCILDVEHLKPDKSIFDIYPNPFSDHLSFSIPKTPGIFQLNMYDVLGNRIKIYEIAGESVTSIAFDDISKGVYVFTIEHNGKRVYSETFVKILD